MPCIGHLLDAGGSERSDFPLHISPRATASPSFPRRRRSGAPRENAWVLPPRKQPDGFPSVRERGVCFCHRLLSRARSNHRRLWAKDLRFVSGVRQFRSPLFHKPVVPEARKICVDITRRGGGILVPVGGSADLSAPDKAAFFRRFSSPIRDTPNDGRFFDRPCFRLFPAALLCAGDRLLLPPEGA